MKALLVDLIQYFINTLLGYVRGFLIRLSSFRFIKYFFLNGYCVGFFIRIKQVHKQAIQVVHPQATIFTLSKKTQKKQPCEPPPKRQKPKCCTKGGNP